MARIEIKTFPDRVEAAIGRGFDRAAKTGITAMRRDLPAGKTGQLRRSARGRRLGPLKLAPVFKLGGHLRHGYVHDSGRMRTRGGRVVRFRHGGGFRERGAKAFESDVLRQVRREMR